LAVPDIPVSRGQNVAAAAVFPWFSTTSLSGNARVSDVRFGSKADMCGAKRHVRFRG